jgi:hypothetical protein
LYPSDSQDLTARLGKAVVALRESAIDGPDLAGYLAHLLDQVYRKTVQGSSNPRITTTGAVVQPLTSDYLRPNGADESRQIQRVEPMDPWTYSGEDWDSWLADPFGHDSNLLYDWNYMAPMADPAVF